MANKTYQARVQSKIDTSENWAKATNFVPLKGEICIYSDLHRMKVGDGTTKINDLDFFETVASSTTLGSIKADAKGESDTVPARIDANGKLWVKGQSPADWRTSYSNADGYIQNRPGGYYSTPSDASVITWDGTKKTGADRIEVADLIDYKMCFYHVSDTKPTLAALVGGTLLINGETVLISDENNCRAIEYEGYIDISDIDVTYINIIYSADVNGFPKGGTWFFVVEDANGNPVNGVTKLQTVAVGDIVKIPGKFLDLPIPDVTAADNNKILKVVNGAWSTANLDKGVLVVNFELLASGDNQKYAQADKTPTDIASALNNGQIVAGVLDYNNVVYILILNNAVNGLVFSTTIASDNNIQTISLVYENNNTRYKIIDEVIESFTDTEIETFYNANA